jgi:hypothetical protein
MLTYDKKENRKKFYVLGSKTTAELNRRIASWLNTNINIEDLIYQLGPEEIDADSLSKASND